VVGDAQSSDYPLVNPGGGTYYFDTPNEEENLFIGKFTIDSLKLNVSPMVSICRGDSTTLTASGAISYQWSPPTGLSATNIANPKASPKVTTTYTVTSIDTSACGRKLIDSVKVIVNTLAGLAITKDTSICTGSSITLNANGGTNYTWSNGATTSSIAINVLTSQTYTLGISNGACSKDTSVRVTVIPLPGIHLSGNTKICHGISDTLKVSGGTTYLWSNGNTTTTYYTGAINADSTITVIAYNSYGCYHDTIITIHSVPFPVPVITAKHNICTGESDTLTASGGTTYLWNNGNTTTTYYTGAIKANSTFTVIAYNSYGCSHDTTIAIHPIPLPIPVITTKHSSCIGEADTLTVSGGTTYLWGNGDTTTTYYTGAINAHSTITLIAYNSYGCHHDTTITLIPDIPNLSACCDAILVVGNDTTLTAKGNKAKLYQWSPEATCINLPLCNSVKVSPTITTTYTVTMTDSSGCQLEKEVTVIVEIPCADFNIPNVFTPDYAGPNGINNLFYITINAPSSWSITIYDRWGKEMFTSTNPNQYWNGNTESGNKAPGGVYYYIISATCQGNTYKKDGFVQVIR